MRIALPSGVSVDVRLRTLFDTCLADRVGCASAISAALDDVDRADRATREPRRTMLRPAIGDGTPPGFTLGYVTEPLVGRFELRYVMDEGLASTFVTSAIADRLGLDRERMKAFATQLGATRLDAAVPATATLYLAKADEGGAKALKQAMAAGGFDLIANDVDAPDGTAMTIAPKTP